MWEDCSKKKRAGLKLTKFIAVPKFRAISTVRRGGATRKRVYQPGGDEPAPMG